MCGIAGVLNLKLKPVSNLERSLDVMNELQEHRGPDGCGKWCHEAGYAGFAQRRLGVIDLSTDDQPERDEHNNFIVFNGAIYNYAELKQELGEENLRSPSDTEVILKAYDKWGIDCVKHFKGVFSFALWDEAKQMLFCARDHFGVKPFYYTMVEDRLYFASEAKALLPFIEGIETDLEGFKEYLTFQFCLAGKTLFKGIHELLPAHRLIAKNGSVRTERYWQIYYNLDFDHTAKYFEEKIESLLLESVQLNLKSDVPVGAYISGGIDSSIVASIASDKVDGDFIGFTGKFSMGKDYDESQYAREMASWKGFELYEADITVNDFMDNISKVIYHLDYPVAGPGSFPQYMVSKLASKYRKVVLGGQGGDEIFGGYTRYLVAYFEQCIKAAIEGTMHSGNFIVTYESIIPNLTALKNYKPMLKEFWKDGLFDDLDKRYFRLINRAPALGDEINWSALDSYSPYETFRSIFITDSVKKESYFDSMTHFDFETLLPALLQVEDRVSMANSVESRVPFLYNPLVELAATIPSNIKFKDGAMKVCLKKAMQEYLPDVIKNRKDKMGFPVPLNEWLRKDAHDFARDIFSSSKALSRELVNNKLVIDKLDKESKFGRNIWGLLSLELWQREFHDKAYNFRQLLEK